MSLEKELADQIKNGHALAFIGSGVSQSATKGVAVASWEGLVRHGLRHCVERGYMKEEISNNLQAMIGADPSEGLLAAAQSVSRALNYPRGGNWASWLRQTVGELTAVDKSLLSAIRDLNLPLATTNYDSLLEQVTERKAVTWRQHGELIRAIRKESNSIMHLHGYWESPASVIFGISSYADILRDDTAQFLQQVLQTYSIVFIGYGEGLSDPNFEALRKWLKTILADREHSHYRLALNCDVEQLRRKHEGEKIEIIGYGDTNDELATFLKTLLPVATKQAIANVTPHKCAATLRIPVVASQIVGKVLPRMLTQDFYSKNGLGNGYSLGNTAVKVEDIFDTRIWPTRFSDHYSDLDAVRRCEMLLLHADDMNDKWYFLAGVARSLHKPIRVFGGDTNPFLRAGFSNDHLIDYRCAKPEELIREIVDVIHNFLQTTHSSRLFYYRQLWSLDVTRPIEIVTSKGIPIGLPAPETADWLDLNDCCDINALLSLRETLDCLYPVDVYPRMTRPAGGTEAEGHIDARRALNGNTNLIILGGPDVNKTAEWLSILCPLGYRYPEKKVVQLWLKRQGQVANDDIYDSLWFEEKRGQDNRRLVDYGFLLRRRYGSESIPPRIFFGGCYTWGTFGATNLGSLTRPETDDDIASLLKSHGSDVGLLVPVKVPERLNAEKNMPDFPRVEMNKVYPIADIMAEWPKDQVVHW